MWYLRLPFQLKLLSSVRSHVPVKVSFMSETLSTLLAGKKSLHSVNLPVGVKVSFLLETFST